MDTLKESDLEMNEKEKEILRAVPEFKPDKSTLDRIINSFNTYFPNYKIETE